MTRLLHSVIAAFGMILAAAVLYALGQTQNAILIAGFAGVALMQGVLNRRAQRIVAYVTMISLVVVTAAVLGGIFAWNDWFVALIAFALIGALDLASGKI